MKYEGHGQWGRGEPKTQGHSVTHPLLLLTLSLSEILPGQQMSFYRGSWGLNQPQLEAA